ncbi:MAG: cell division protein FtsQ/DivIB [Fusobacteriaceae bacterium]
MKVELKFLADTIKDKNMWFLDLKFMEEKISKDVRISKVNIKFYELGKMKIEVFQKEPSYYISFSKKMYLADEEGAIFAFMNELKVKDLPIIHIVEEQQTSEIINIFSKMNDENLVQMVSQVYYLDKNQIDFVIGNNSRIKTNVEVSNVKYSALRDIFLNISKTSKIEYIDLRFDGYIVKGTGVDRIAN